MQVAKLHDCIDAYKGVVVQFKIIHELCMASENPFPGSVVSLLSFTDREIQFLEYTHALYMQS